MHSDDNTYSITSQVTDAVTATYTHTLTVAGSISAMCPTSGHPQEVAET